MCAPISSIRSTYDDPVTKRGVLLAGLLLALAALVPQAQAKIRTVQLTNDGPSPAGLTLRAGDVVRFVNADNVPHQVRSQGGWQYDSGPIPPGQTSSATPRLTAPGTYRYSDVRSIVILPRTFTGSLTVPAPTPAPSPTTGPTATPTPKPTPVRTSSPAPSATSSPTSSATSPAPSAPPTVRPTPVQTTSAQPVPSPSRPSPTPSLNLLYGEPSGLVQSSPHRYGLPALVAGVAIGGVLSLLGRYLLSLPEGRRTGSS
jgi:plastocyanin